MQKPNKRYTPKHSTLALYQSWRLRDPADPRLNEYGKRLAAAAQNGYKSFDDLCRKILPEL